MSSFIGAADRFSYVAATTVTTIASSSGPASGGTNVAITGYNFTGASAVKFGNSAATFFTLNSGPKNSTFAQLTAIISEGRVIYEGFGGASGPTCAPFCRAQAQSFRKLNAACRSLLRRMDRGGPPKW
jgi:hypothetical protein